MSEDLLCKEKLRLHLIYWAIIFGILAVCLLVIAPGCVNPKAFENFSFASTIVSIVLAVVSIVYSFRSKSSTIDNIAGIRVIEQNIDLKLQNFDALGEKITREVKDTLSGLKQDMSDLKDDQKDFKSTLDQMVSDQKRFFDADTQSVDNTGNGNSTLISRTSFIGKIALLMAYLSFTHKKSLDFSLLSNLFTEDKDYYWGYYAALTASHSGYFEYSVTNSTVFEIKKYNEKKLGDYNYWRRLIKSDTDSGKFSKEYLDEIEKYFEQSKEN